MSELALTRDERLALRARAHPLRPVVLLGAAGLTDAVLKETDRALTAHELIKVRVPGDDRDAREAIAAQIAAQLGAARVQIIGKLLVLYRPRPQDDTPAPSIRASTQRHGSTQRSPRPASTAVRAGSGGPARPARAVPRRGGPRGR